MRVGGSIIIALACLVASCGNSSNETADADTATTIDGSFDSSGNLDAPFPSVSPDACDLQCMTGLPTVALRVMDAQGNSVPGPTFSVGGQPLKPSACGEAVAVDGGSFDTVPVARDGGAQAEAADGGPSNCNVWVFIASSYSRSAVWQVIVSAPGYATQTVTVPLYEPTGCTCAGAYGSQTVTLLSSDGGSIDGGSPVDAAPASDGDSPGSE
jgi:hypothetical protein